MKNGAPFIIGLLVGLGWWLEYGWVAGVVVGGTMAVLTLGVVIWSIVMAPRSRRS